MRIETVEKEVYNFEDLKTNEELKEKVLYVWRNTTKELHWSDEIYESLKGFENSVDGLEPENEEFSGLRLRTWIINNYLNDLEKGKGYYNKSKTRRSKIQFEISCPFTGVCFDMEYLDPILEFIKEPSTCDTWESLVKDGKNQYSECIRIEENHQNSDEYILETIEANDYEFTIDGKIY